MSETRTDFLSHIRQDSDIETTERPLSHNDISQNVQSDIADSFELFKAYFDVKISSLRNELSTGNDNLAKMIKEDVSVKLKGEGNQIQFKFNSELITDLNKLLKRISADDSTSVNLVSGLLVKLNKRNKLIRIADKCPAGWSTVKEYESDDLASDSEDEKRLRQAENRALKGIREKKLRQHPYRKPSATITKPHPMAAPVVDTRFNYSTQQPFRTFRWREPTPYDICYGCNQYGHWKKNCTLSNSARTATQVSSAAVPKQ